MTIHEAAYHGSLIADAFAMPVHWYYNREAMDRDYPNLDRHLPPLDHHPDSILWRSEYTSLNEKGEILHDQSRFWGQRHVHYRRNLKAGENTVNFKLAQALYDQVSTSIPFQLIEQIPSGHSLHLFAILPKFSGMFCDATTHPFSPSPKTPWLQTSPHHLDDLRLGQSVLSSNLINGRPILPSHSNHLIAQLLIHGQSINSIAETASHQ